MKSSRDEVQRRRNALVTLLRQGVRHADDLAEQLSVSSATIRRDLAALEQSGDVVRTLGGATTTPFKERHLRDRMDQQASAKRAIAEAACEFMPDEGLVFLDAGSTCAALAAMMNPGPTVVTRGLEIGIISADRGIDVVLCGGQIAPLSHGCSGSVAEATLSTLSFSVAFFGVDAVDPVDGLGEPTIDEIGVKRVVASRSARSIVLADHTKLETSHVPCWLPLPEWTLVTDDHSAADRFDTSDITLIRA